MPKSPWYPPSSDSSPGGVSAIMHWQATVVVLPTTAIFSALHPSVFHSPSDHHAHHI